jgi:iron complex outermembrane recepter protein
MAAQIACPWEVDRMMYRESRASRARLLVGAVSGVALAAGLGLPALAQTADPAASAAEEVAPDEVVVVTGLRASLRNSVNVKRNLDVIAEVVSAEDIGKLPDISITESIARLPGLAAERVDGRASRISLRGLGPDNTTTLLNGREQVSTNDARGADFDQYPSELISQVRVYKTADATLSAQGIAGTIDLRTTRPLSSPEFAVVSGRYQWNSLGEVMPDVDGAGYRATAAISRRFANDTLGVAFGVAYLDSPNVTNRTEAYDTASTVDLGGTRGRVFSPGGLKVMASSSVLERVGAMGVVQWRPSERFSLTGDLYYSSFTSEQNNRGVEINLGAGVNGGWIADSIRTTNNYITSGTFIGRFANRNIFNGTEAEMRAAGLNAEYELTDNTKVTFDLGYSSAVRDTVFIETQPCAGAACTGTGTAINYSLQPSGAIQLSIPGVDLNNPQTMLLADPYNWGAQGFIKFPSIDDELITMRLDLVTELSGDKGVDELRYGLMRSDRSKERTFREGFLRNPGGASIPIPSSAIVGSVDLGFGGLGRALAFDPRAIINTPGGLRQEIATDWWAVLKDWNVEEVVTTAYFQGNIDTEFGGVPTSGNFGVQIVHTEQSSTGLFGAYFLGNNGQSGATEQRSATESYAEILPSLNLNFEVAENLYLRIGANRVYSRPNMSDMRISREINFDPSRIDSTDPFRSPYTGDGGNPLLRPTLSRNFDIALERYFGQGGVITLGLFQKNLETYLRPGGDRFFIDLSNYPAPAWLGREPLIRTAYVSTPGNAEGGVIKGLEFQVNLPFEVFSEALDGFGMTANFAQNASEIEFADSRAGPSELPGLSKTTANLAFYYEKYGFQARISSRYRSSFLQEIVAFDANIERRVSDPENIIDAQIGYTFPEGSMLNGLSVQLQGLNLGEEAWITYYDEYGTTWMLGATYRF